MIDKIKAEIERRREKCADIAAEASNEEVAEYYRGKEVAYDETLSFIESLEKGQEVDLEKAYKSYMQSRKDDLSGNAVTINMKDLARHFYELGCRHTAVLYDDMERERQRRCEEEKSEIPTIPQGLDEAAEEEAKKWGNEYFQYRGWLSYCFKAGAKWMAEQFQKIEGELVDWYETKGVDYCCGIKTEDAFEVPKGFYIRKK